MESSSIEIKVMSCKDLKAFHFFQKLWIYAVVSIVSDDPNKKLEQSQQQRTQTDKEGDKNPEWNHELRFDLDEALLQDCDHLFVHFDLRLEVVVFGDRTIGEVRVPFKDLIDESNGIVRFVSYEVRTADGKPNGVLNFSYKVNLKTAAAASAAPKIDGFSTVHHNPSPEIHNPTPEVHNPSPEIHYPTPEVHNPSPSEVHYPSLDQHNPLQETYSTTPQEVHYQSPTVQHTSHETYYPPPHAPPLLPLLPGPPPPFMRPPWLHPPPHRPPPPPPPPHPHGAFHHPRPPWIHHWAPDPQRTGGPADSGETWPNGDRYPSFRNGR